MTQGNNALKLPGGCLLVDRKPDSISKINTKQINIIPFRRYRLDPVEDAEEWEEEWTREEIWAQEHPVLDTLLEISLPLLTFAILFFGGLFF